MKAVNKVSFLILVVLVSVLSSCEMKKDLFGEIDKSTDNKLPAEKAGMLDLELKPNKEADIPESKGGQKYH